MTEKIIAVIVAIALSIGAWFYTVEFKDIKNQLDIATTENISLSNQIVTINKVYEQNNKLLKDELKIAQDATKSAVVNASASNDKFINTQKELNEKTIKYNRLVADGYRLRDAFKTGSGNSQGNCNSGQGTDKKDNSTTTTIGNDGTCASGLSEGLSKYLISRAIAADTNTEQLINLQEFTKKQHQWILNSCNAVEAQ